MSAEQKTAGWSKPAGGPPLAEIFGTVKVPAGSGWLRKAFAFTGPGYLVATGYMDPGNWATALAGGSKFGYTLLSVAVISSLMAILLQSLCVRLAFATGRDLAQACRDSYPRPVAFVLWVLAELAICATDLAEVIGTAIGLNLLFGIPLEIGVLITAFDVFLILWLQSRGFRYVEAIIGALLATIAACFAVQLAMAQPELGAIIRGIAPTTEVLRNPDMLLIALGIIGATVMPHNLYLHSAIVQSRAVGTKPEQRREAIRYATFDSTIALSFALVINSSILILAASAFNRSGNSEVAELGQAHALLAPLLGSTWAPTLFALALLCCGFSSTITATIAGQAVMEGFLNIRLAPWLRRLLTRSIAIVPAVIVIFWYGEKETGRLLVLSQVVLSFQLPFAIVPLVLMTADRSKMGDLVAPRWLTVIAVAIAAVIIGLNVKLLVDTATGS
jgi:manganese transport protein